MKSLITIAITFIIMVFLLLIGISMFASIPLPEPNTTANATYHNLSTIVNLSYEGFYAIMLILVVLMLLVVVLSWRKR